MKPWERLFSSGQGYLFALRHATTKPMSTGHSAVTFRRFFVGRERHRLARRARSATG